MEYRASDGNGDWNVEADSLEEALEIALEDTESVDLHNDSTLWFTINVYDSEGESLSDTVVVEPIEPDCETGLEHDWISGPAYGSGGGVKWNETCSHCECIKSIDTWANRPDTGEEGFYKVEYQEAE